MTEARRVGSVHVHRLPDEDTVPKWDVYRCECNKEFFRGSTDKMNEPTWIPMDGASHYVEYADTEVDAPLIGRWSPETPGLARPEKTEEPEVEPAPEVPAE